MGRNNQMATKRQDSLLKYKLLIEQSNIPPAEKEEINAYLDKQIQRLVKQLEYEYNRKHLKDKEDLKNLIYSILPPPGYCVTFEQIRQATGLTHGEVKYRMDDLVKEGKVIRHKIRKGTKRPTAYEKVEHDFLQIPDVPPDNIYIEKAEE